MMTANENGNVRRRSIDRVDTTIVIVIVVSEHLRVDTTMIVIPGTRIGTEIEMAANEIEIEANGLGGGMMIVIVTKGDGKEIGKAKDPEMSIRGRGKGRGRRAG